MDRATEIALCKKLLHYVDTRTTALADAPWENASTPLPRPSASPANSRPVSRLPAFDGYLFGMGRARQYRTDDLAGIPILMVRGNDGVLRAFLNVCRHRGAKVAGWLRCNEVVSLSLSRLDL